MKLLIGAGLAALVFTAQAIAQDAKPAAKAQPAKATEAAGHGAHDHAPAKKPQQQPWGIAGDAKAVRRTVEITMLDTMRFSPDKVEVAQGDTVRFVVKNGGKQAHEMVIGTRKSLDEHAAQMLKMQSMGHDEPDSAHIDAGKSGVIIWNFNRAGDFDFACLIPGHFQAGMRGSIRVAAASTKKK